MADPFSIVTGALGTIDACINLARYLNDVVRGFKSIEDDIQHLLHRVTTIQKVAGTIKATFEAEWDSQPRPADKDQTTINGLWQYTGEYLSDCLSIVSELNNLICRLLGRPDGSTEIRPHGLEDHHKELDSPTSSLTQQTSLKMARLKLFIRKKGKEREFLKIETRLDQALKSADLMLNAINLATTCQAQRRTSSSIGDFSNEIVAGLDYLDQQIQQMRKDFWDSQANTASQDSHLDVLTVEAAENIRPLATLNEHFSLPRAVTSIYTGRREALDDLRSFFFGATSGTGRGSQKRFCIYGLGGSGKTEFCCKFAQENQNRLWAVFWIDASSPDRVRQTYSAIAKEGKRDPNERAAKAWLASSERPWLLIIDGADHDADLEELEDYIPEGASGMILVTTRNPVHRTLGTVGCRYFQFKELIEEDANSLLLTTAEEPRPWTVTTQKLASPIAKSLGFLPLPLRHAGYAIMKQLATLSNYLTYYEGSWQRVRRSRKSIAMDEDEHLKAYASYEIMYAGLEAKKTAQSRDALDLLKTFAG
ncbi:uncharacterized protein Z518_08197 [Rhinocladiella mackenziei CBS 650.93]|uniref:Fungal N-terminal domain-containing protein n=1 Tax=Rhinocladiella mackenziei CBS 650.93 TaxID=1442369 RepID=A0A0D2GVF3_9EURO|nr:uncharacterized protein Z518_08197 [Rhinocladiella mackenziei CBS 650.93]KIX02258.1 hypothetical protein Z518_08197 [Rhinocladiella mackenziei CBS 650.93]